MAQRRQKPGLSALQTLCQVQPPAALIEPCRKQNSLVPGSRSKLVTCWVSIWSWATASSPGKSGGRHAQVSVRNRGGDRRASSSGRGRRGPSPVPESSCCRGTESHWTQSVLLNGPRAGAVPLCRASQSQIKDPHVGSLTVGTSVGVSLGRKEGSASL